MDNYLDEIIACEKELYEIKRLDLLYEGEIKELVEKKPKKPKKPVLSMRQPVEPKKPPEPVKEHHALRIILWFIIIVLLVVIATYRQVPQAFYIGEIIAVIALLIIVFRLRHKDRSLSVDAIMATEDYEAALAQYKKDVPKYELYKKQYDDDMDHYHYLLKVYEKKSDELDKEISAIKEKREKLKKINITDQLDKLYAQNRILPKYHDLMSLVYLHYCDLSLEEAYARLSEKPRPRYHLEDHLADEGLLPEERRTIQEIIADESLAERDFNAYLKQLRNTNQKVSIIIKNT